MVKAYESGRAIRADAGFSGAHGARGSHWVITRSGHGPAETFTVRTPGGEAVPVFSLKEEAWAFLDTIAGRGWRLEEAGVRELLSLLSEPRGSVERGGVGRVVLDPPDATDEAMLGVLSVGREVFLDSLLGRGRAWFEDGRSRHARRGSWR